MSTQRELNEELSLNPLKNTPHAQHPTWNPPKPDRDPPSLDIACPGCGYHVKTLGVWDPYEHERSKRWVHSLVLRRHLPKLPHTRRQSRTPLQPPTCVLMKNTTGRITVTTSDISERVPASLCSSRFQTAGDGGQSRMTAN